VVYAVSHPANGATDGFLLILAPIAMIARVLNLDLVAFVVETILMHAA